LLRAMGASPAQIALVTGLAGAVAVIAGTVFAAAGAIVSPLAPATKLGLTGA